MVLHDSRDDMGRPCSCRVSITLTVIGRSRFCGGRIPEQGEYEDKLLALTVDAPKSVDGYIYVELVCRAAGLSEPKRSTRKAPLRPRSANEEMHGR